MKKIMVLMVLLVLSSGVSYAKDKFLEDKNYMTIYAQGTCINRDITIVVMGKLGPLEDAEVDVFVRGRKVDWGYGNTDENGTFRFKATKAGTHEIQVEADGYYPNSTLLNISSTCVSDATTTSIKVTTTLEATTTSSTTTTTTSTSTTIIGCNFNGACEIQYLENYKSCPSDCMSGGSDGVCDKKNDSVCDPDCDRRSDVDCFCNKNDVCDPGFETYDQCPQDCRRDVKDGYCDRTKDGYCDPDCGITEDPDCIDYGKTVSDMLPILALMALLFGAVFIFGFKRQKTSYDLEKARDDLIDEIVERLKNGEDPKDVKKDLLARGKDLSIYDIAEKRLWQ